MNKPDLPEPTAPQKAVLEEVLDEIGGRVESVAMNFATEGNPKLERMGLRYFAKRARKKGPIEIDDPIHVLNPGELKRIRQAVWTAIGWAAFIGFMAGVASGIAELVGEQWHGGPQSKFVDNWRYHLLVQGVTIIATLIEVWALYAVGLRAAHDVAYEAGFSLDGADKSDATGSQRDVALALARAALELPNPPTNSFGIDPYRSMPKWRVVLAVIVYKLKITVTTFVVKTLIARASTRVGLKAWLSFVSAPVTAIWDGAVMWLVLRQVRLRVLGHSAATELLEAIALDHPTLSATAKEAMARAVAAAVVHSSELHPNHALLMKVLPIDPRQVTDLDDPQRLSSALAALNEEERIAVLELLAMAILIDGRLDRRERKLWRELGKHHGYAPCEKRLATLGRQFARGRPWSRKELTEAIGVPTTS